MKRLLIAAALIVLCCVIVSNGQSEKSRKVSPMCEEAFRSISNLNKKSASDFTAIRKMYDNALSCLQYTIFELRRTIDDKWNMVNKEDDKSPVPY